MDPLMVTPSFSNFLQYLSNDQRRIIATILVKNGQLKPLMKILDEEGPVALREYNKWKEGEEETKRRGSNSDTMTDTSSIPACDFDSDDDDDPNSDPEKWTPKIRDDFFENFPPEMNILILGETGVGKSTFINALANYLQFGNMYQARGHFDILIKTAFTYTDDNYKQYRIECNPTIAQESGDEDNERVDVGQSSTQAPKSYLISCGPPDKARKVRIIDTPGIGDIRGTEQEKDNFKNILTYISQYKDLHAVCILMKSNETRLALNFRHCLNELFSHLHISARNNLLFCFTNSRQTMYKPGDILPSLQVYLKKLGDKTERASKRVDIPLNGSTMFCFDNESFRFLCAFREGATITRTEMVDFHHSWKITVKETFRLLKTISQLPVHKVADTIAVNNIRNAMIALAKPAAEFSKNQLLNIQLIGRKIKEIEDCMKHGKSLTGKLFAEQVQLVPEELSHPITVCASQRCIEYRKIGTGPNAKMEVIYKTICHSPCSLEGVQTESRPNPSLRSCYIFQTADKVNRCKHCGCGWEEHIHRRYKLDKEIKKVLDPDVESMLSKSKNTKAAAKLFLKKERERQKEYEGASNVALTRAAEFAAYLKENSILPYNDAYKEYIDRLIKDEKKVISQGGSPDHLKVLEANKEAYEAHIEAIENQKTSAGTKTAEEIQRIAAEFKNTKDCSTVLQDPQQIHLIDLQRKKTSKDVEIKTTNGWFSTKFNSFISGTASMARTGVMTVASSFRDTTRTLLSFGRRKK